MEKASISYNYIKTSKYRSCAFKNFDKGFPLLLLGLKFATIQLYAIIKYSQTDIIFVSTGLPTQILHYKKNKCQMVASSPIRQLDSKGQGFDGTETQLNPD